MVALEPVLPGELPVRLDDVASLPRDLEVVEVVAGEVCAGEALGDRLGCLTSQRDEDHAVPHLDPGALQVPAGAVEVVLHLRSRPHGAVEVIRPAVVRADEPATAHAALVGNDGRAAVAAHVVERVHRSVLASDHDHAVAREVEAHELPARRDLRLVAHEPPSGLPKPLDLEREVFGIDVLVPFEADLRKLGDRDLDSHRSEPPWCGRGARPSYSWLSPRGGQRDRLTRSSLAGG